MGFTVTIGKINASKFGVGNGHMLRGAMTNFLTDAFSVYSATNFHLEEASYFLRFQTCGYLPRAPQVLIN